MWWITTFSRMGIKNIYLWVLEENVQAQEFYKKHGFRETEDKIFLEISGKEVINIKFIHRENWEE